MERLGVVTVPALGGRPWRAIIWPVVALLAVTVAIGLIRSELRTHASSPSASRTAARHAKPAHRKVGRLLYHVRAGDTVNGIASRTGIPATRLLKLNPGISPTALFIGEKIRLR